MTGNFLMYFGNLVSRSCSTYLDKVTTFSLLKITFSSSVSHETMADLIVFFNCNRVFWYTGSFTYNQPRRQGFFSNDYGWLRGGGGGGVYYVINSTILIYS